jgi:cytochrome c
MKQPSVSLWLALCVLGGISSAAHARDELMQALAQRSGCTQCHSIGADRSALDDTLPLGPSWQEVAAKYQGQRGAARQLVRAVRAGSSADSAHWRGQVAGQAMPPNAVVVSERDARRLVRWILSL